MKTEELERVRNLIQTHCQKCDNNGYCKRNKECKYGILTTEERTEYFEYMEDQADALIKRAGRDAGPMEATVEEYNYMIHNANDFGDRW